MAAKNVSALTGKGAGFDVMSFASNHAVDYGLAYLSIVFPGLIAEEDIRN